MNYTWNVMVSWLLWQFLIHVIPVQSYQKEVIIPVSSVIRLKCDDGLRVNNIHVTIRRSNISCFTTSTECTLPDDANETIQNSCNNKVSCEANIHDIIIKHECLQDYGYVNILYTCKKRIDFSCDFDSSMCNWSSLFEKYRFRWLRGRRGNTKLPTVDHTSASSTGKYVYIYSSSNGNDIEFDTAKLESKHIIATQQQCFSFWYFTKNSRDSINVYQNEDHLLDLSYDYEEEIWHHIRIPLEKKSNDSYQLVFEVIRGNTGSYGAIVIDDILIENQNCDSFILQCDFESSECDWKNEESNEYSWNKQMGQPLHENRGPSTDHSTASEHGHYMYLGKPREDFTRAMDYASYLEYQNLNLHVPGEFCLTFWYHIYDSDFGKERLNVTLDDKLVWTKTGYRENKWKSGTIDLHSRNIFSIKFIGIFDGNKLNTVNIAVDDISISKGTCKGLFYHEELCVQLDDKTPLGTECPKRYLDIQNQRLSFDPEKQICSDIYEQTKIRLLKECEKREDAQKCYIDLSMDKSFHPECFQLYDLSIMHTCEDEEPTTVSSVITSKSYSSAVSEETFTAARVMGNSSDSETGLVVGLVIGALLLVCVVIMIIVLIRRHTSKSNPREKIRNNLSGNDYIGSQDIALPLTANHWRHMQNDGKYNRSSDTSVHGHVSTQANAHINNVQHEYTNVGAVNGFVDKEKVQISTYAHRQDKTFADNHMPNDDEYAIVDPTAETRFNKNTDTRNGTADSYMVLDPTQTGFNRQIFANTPVDYAFAKPAKDLENKIDEDDQYAISDGVYDHSGNNRHKESEVYIYNHAVDTIYDSGSHKRNDEGREDTYDHFFGQTTEDDYDISTIT